MDPKRLNLLVTGGAGYIGSHMCKLLRRAGHDVTVLDNLSRGHADAVAGLPLIHCDLTDRDAVAAALAGSAFDAVLHFAGLTYVGESVRDPAAYYRNNVAGTLNLLDAMRATGTSPCRSQRQPRSIPSTPTGAPSGWLNGCCATMRPRMA